MSHYYGPKTIYAFDDTKRSSLWFDYVIPLFAADLIAETDDVGYPIVLKELLPPHLHTSSTRLYSEYMMGHVFLRLDQSAVQYIRSNLGGSSAPDEIMNLQKQLRAAERRLKRRKDIFGRQFEKFVKEEHKAREGQPDDSEIEKRPAEDNTSQGNWSEISIAFSGLQLIDQSSLTWRQIIEFRKDRESVKSLRQLRLFLYENYRNKTHSYIKDDLLRRIDEYERTAAKWGIRTAAYTLQCVFSSKSLPAAAAAAIVASLGSGMPLALAIGGAFELGHIGLTVLEKTREQTLSRTLNPVSYLVSVKALTATGADVAAGGAPPYFWGSI